LKLKELYFSGLYGVPLSFPLTIKWN